MVLTSEEDETLFLDKAQRLIMTGSLYDGNVTYHKHQTKAPRYVYLYYTYNTYIVCIIYTIIYIMLYRSSNIHSYYTYHTYKVYYVYYIQ